MISGKLRMEIEKIIAAYTTEIKNSANDYVMLYSNKNNMMGANKDQVQFIIEAYQRGLESGAQQVIEHFMMKIEAASAKQDAIEADIVLKAKREA